MGNQAGLQRSQSTEEALKALFGTIAPDEDFVNRLEQQLLAQRMVAVSSQVAHQEARHGLWPLGFLLFGRQRWALAAISLLLVVATLVSFIGPQRVLAEFWRMFGYVPGIGFVDFENARVLAAPVAVSRDGITLRVEQVVSQKDRTVVAISSEGLPPEDRLWPRDDKSGEKADFTARLRMPDGSVLEMKTWTLRLGAGTLTFAPIPDGIYRTTLEVKRLPLVPSGAAPEDWAVPLELRPATGELVAELFPPTYAPEAAVDTHHNITLRVLEVAQTAERTVLRLQVQWPHPDWRFTGIEFASTMPWLSDDLGHIYNRPVVSSNSAVASVVQAITPGEPAPTPTVPTREETKEYVAVSPSARQLTYTVESLSFNIPAEGGFVVNLGDNPQIGDYWPLDVTLNAAGVPVRITGVRLTRGEKHTGEGIQPTWRLDFDVVEVPQGDDQERYLHWFGLSVPQVGYGSGGNHDFVTGRRHQYLDLDELPQSPLTVRLESAEVEIRGPWVVTWPVADAGLAPFVRTAPVTYRPEKVSQTRGGVTLQLAEVTRTDRLTALRVTPVHLPADMTFSGLVAWNAKTNRDELYLSDERGYRYNIIHDVRWQGGGGSPVDLWKNGGTDGRLTFEPLSPLARQATLHIPEIALIRSARETFSITVPPDLTMVESQTLPGTRASGLWNVDIPLEVAGYRLRFTQAEVMENGDRFQLKLFSAPFQARHGDRCLTSLRLASVTAPDGQPVPLDRELGTPACPADEPYRLTLFFDVTEPKTRALQPGTYRIEVEGVGINVVGPWLLKWNLSVP
jgi:hypothetical protein